MKTLIHRGLVHQRPSAHTMRMRGEPSVYANLNYEGVEVILIGAGDEVPKELKDQFTDEDVDAANLPGLEELKLDSPDHPTKPLFSGEWE